MAQMNDEARKLKNAYQREWIKKNPEKIRKYTIDFWNRKAAGYSLIQKVCDLSQKGLSQRAIAGQLNISLGAVNAYLNKVEQ